MRISRENAGGASGLTGCIWLRQNGLLSWDQRRGEEGLPRSRNLTKVGEVHRPFCSSLPFGASDRLCWNAGSRE